MVEDRVSRVSFPETSNGKLDLSTLSLESKDDNPSSSCCGEEQGRELYHQILSDTESRKLLTEHKKYLQRLVATKHKDLHSMGFHHMHSSSLRSIVSERLDRSLFCLQRLEADITEATDDWTDFSEHRFDGHLVFDFDEQMRALDISHNSSRRENGDEAKERGDNDDSEYDDDSFALPPLASESGGPLGVPASNRSIPLSPDVSAPLRGASETWQAIRSGATTAITCSGCNASLHVIEDAEYVVCPDCWMVGSVEWNIGGIMFECDGSSTNFGLGLGVKAEEVVQWVEEQTSKSHTI